MSDFPVLQREAEKHLKVVRPKNGEEIELFNGKGLTRRYRYDAATRRLVPSSAEPLRTWPRAPGSLTLFACVTKGSRWDWTIEKATELGVTRIVPVLSARTIVRLTSAERATKAERWRRIAEEAARQSNAVWLPEITEATDFDAVLPSVTACACFVGALTDPPPSPLLSALASLSSPPLHLALFIGPEGDLAPDELSSLLSIATPVSLGPTILRSETAALYGISVLAAYRAALKESLP